MLQPAPVELMRFLDNQCRSSYVSKETKCQKKQLPNGTLCQLFHLYLIKSSQNRWLRYTNSLSSIIFKIALRVFVAGYIVGLLKSSGTYFTSKLLPIMSPSLLLWGNGFTDESVIHERRDMTSFGVGFLGSQWSGGGLCGGISGWWLAVEPSLRVGISKKIRGQTRPRKTRGGGWDELPVLTNMLAIPTTEENAKAKDASHLNNV